MPDIRAQPIDDAALREQWEHKHLANNLKDVSGDMLRKQQAEFLQGREWVNEGEENNSSLFHAYQTLAPLKRAAQKPAEQIYKLPEVPAAAKLPREGVLAYFRENIFGVKANKTEKPAVMHDNKPTGPKNRM